MSMTMTLVLLVQILAALTMSGLILMQHGKGADMGAAFGSGSAGSLFGASGSANFLSRMTALSATIFFAATLVMALLASAGHHIGGGPSTSVLEGAPITMPAETGPASAIPGAGGAATHAPQGGHNAASEIPGAASTVEHTTGEPHPAPAVQQGGHEAEHHEAAPAEGHNAAEHTHTPAHTAP